MLHIPKDYYVYAYIREDLTPYYIGKGKGKRAWDKGKSHVIKPPTNLNYIIILEEGLTDIGALAIERRMIKWYGRKDLGTGILRNKSDGGDGACGAIRTKEHKDAISKAIKGRVSPTKGFKHPSSFGDEISKRLKGHKGTCTRKCMSPNGIIYNTIKEAAESIDMIPASLRYWIITNKNGWSYL